MTLENECHIPDISDLETPVLTYYILKLVYHNKGGSPNSQVNATIHAYIRAVDKTVRSYNQGRDVLLVWCSNRDRLTKLFHALDEFETCIITTKRCLAFIKLMVRHRHNPGIRREDRKVLDYYLKQISPIRNHIEHLDEELKKFHGPDGQPITLALSKDCSGIEIREEKLEFANLAKLIKKLHEVSRKLASRER